MAVFLRNLVFSPSTKHLAKNVTLAKNVASFSTCAQRWSKAVNELDELPDPLDLATGLEKRELLAELAGDPDPFNVKIRKRGAGTRDLPTEVPSAFEARIVGCICEEESPSISWMWLYEGKPKRCACGHWFKLTYKAPV
uniref:Cytochrome c oxidase subunit 5B, mitochondrial n=1 Tax=Cacopsylla melanoneura TaxID=428564 RepID=A0A8D8PNC9_9HEMI